MLISKQATLKPLLESKDGIHLTAYLVNRGDMIDFKSQLRTTIDEVYDWLDTAMSPDGRNKFLEPLEALLNDARIFKQMKGHIVIFRNEDSFRILNIPIDIQQSCQVATSFHVKPLLRWLQGDQEFLLLGLEKDSAHLYLGSQDSFKMVDSVSLKAAHQNRMKKTEAFSWVNDWILDDLAQMVLSQGGEVIVAKRDEIPKGRPILAILEDDALALEKTEELQYEVLQERLT